MDLHYITFIKNLETRKKSTLIRITSSAGINRMNIVNCVIIFNYSVAMNDIFSG